MTKDLFPVGLIYFIIIGSGIHLKQSYDLFYQKEETRYAMKIAIDIDKDFKKSKEVTFLPSYSGNEKMKGAVAKMQKEIEI